MRPDVRTDAAFLDDIREACALIMKRVEGKKLPDFVNNRDLQDSIMLRLIVLGEASKNLSETARRRLSSVQWKDMIRLRDFAVHHYWNIDALKIWKMVQSDVPKLAALLDPLQ